jgi:RNA polymerase sigma-70 factor (ECF subfamily)
MHTKAFADNADAAHAQASGFVTTHWSVVLEAGQGDSREAAEALERLCRAYWYPLYTCVRRQGHGPHDACDLTQQFLAGLLEKKYLQRADPSRGRFRSFLLSSLKNFLVDEWRKEKAAKRGGAHPVLSLDVHSAEERYAAEPADSLAPDKVYERNWALTLLERVLERLRLEFQGPGKPELFEALEGYLWGDDDAQSYGELSTRLGMTEGGVKVAAHRFRARYRELLRAEVACTVADPGEVDKELKYLLRVVGS